MGIDKKIIGRKKLLNINNIEYLKKIGSGSYGTIFKILIDKKFILAMKTIEISNKYGIRSINEIDIMSKLHHPNIISILSIGNVPCYANLYAIIMPLAFGNLSEYVKKNKPNIDIKTGFFYEILSGVNFLHQNNIIHLDLTCYNILMMKIESGVKAVVADFGLSSYTNNDGRRYSNNEYVTITYRAPEAFLKNYNDKGDAWSIGMIILKILLDNSPIFNDYERIYLEIIEKFNSRNRKKTLEKMFYPCGKDNCSDKCDHGKEMDIIIPSSCISIITNPIQISPMVKISHSDKIKKYIKLLDKILILDPDDRYSVGQIILSPIFELYQNKNNGIIYHPIIKKNERDDMLLFYRGIDLLIRTCFKMKTTTESLFLAVDIFQRTVTLNNGNDTWLQIILRVMACFWISLKIFNESIFECKDIVILSSNSFTEDKLLEIENKIINYLDGIIYRDNLFTSSQCIHKLLISFEYLKNFFNYPELDLDSWKKFKISQCEDKCKLRSIFKNNKSYNCDMFSEFYLLTDYYKWFSGLKKDEEMLNNDYVEYFFKRDLHKHKSKIKSPFSSPLLSPSSSPQNFRKSINYKDNIDRTSEIFQDFLKSISNPIIIKSK